MNFFVINALVFLAIVAVVAVSAYRAGRHDVRRGYERDRRLLAENQAALDVRERMMNLTAEGIEAIDQVIKEVGR